jgi:hypothetical protein
MQVVLGTGASSSGNTQYAMKGPVISDMEMSSHDPPSRSAKVVFSVLEAVKAGPVLGLLKFASGCGGDRCNSAACCESATCADTCSDSKGDSCKTACFKLSYFDDLAPRITANSDLSGPEIGGSIVKLTIAMFSQVVLDSGKNALVSCIFDGKSDLMGVVYVRTSTAEETIVDLLTPSIPLGALSAKSVPVVLQVLSRPDRSLTFQYKVTSVEPKLRSVTPAACYNTKPTAVTISIQYFPYPDDAVVMFGSGFQIQSENITILAVSNIQRTVMTFISPVAVPGVYQVVVFPKSCPQCGKSVTFPFTLRDINQPELLKPIPTKGQRYPAADVLDFVRINKFPTSHLKLAIRCVVDSRTTFTVDPTFVKLIELKDGVASISYRRPPINITGMINVSIDIFFQIQGDKGTDVASLVFPFEIYDETLLRVVMQSPEAVSTRLVLYGRTMELRSRMDLILSNFPPSTPSSDIRVLLLGGEADVLSISEISNCVNLLGDCRRTRVSIFLPAVDPPGVWSGQLSIKGNPVLDFNVTYFTPCDLKEFCEARGQVVDRYLLSTRVPTTSDCGPQYCLIMANILDPQIVSFFPSEGPSTGGTIVNVKTNNLAAFTKSDLAIEVGSGASKVSLSPETVSQDAGSSTTSSRGLFTFKMPPVAGGVFRELSETSVAFKVALGMQVKSTGFNFQYTPVVQGAAAVSSFYPSRAFPGVDTEVKVQVTNFPRLGVLDPEQVQVQFENTGQVFRFSASSISSSSHAGTLFSFKTGEHLKVVKMTTICVYYSLHGIERAGTLNFEVLPEPTPTLLPQSMFPLGGRANVVLNQAVTILFIDPAIASAATWTVRLSGLVTRILERPTVTVQSSTGCTQRYCAKFMVQYQVPKDAIPLQGGTVEVTISAGSEKITFTLTFDADNTPSVESIDPASMGIEQTNTDVIKIYLKNVKPTFCFQSASCTVMFGDNKGIVDSGSYANNIMTLVIRPPATGTGGSVLGLISDEDVRIDFVFNFVSPPASLEPIDGACTGGEILTFQVLGWGQVLQNTNAIKVLFGEKEGKVTQIVSSVASAFYSRTTLRVSTPILGSQGTYTGVISSGLKSSSFALECFAAPTAVVSPATAALDGRTSSNDGKSIFLRLANFPKIATTADVLVKFGNIVCDASACSIVSFSNSASGVTLVLTPPKVAVPAKVLVSVSYTGPAEPPKNGDPSKVYVRTERIAKTSFSFFRPNPIVISAKWCSRCAQGRACLVNGRCLDNVSPKGNSMGSSGVGTLTVVAENLPKISVDANGVILSPAMAEVTFGDYFGTVRKVLYSDEVKSAFEVSLKSPVSGGKVSMDLKVFEDSSTPISYSAISVINFFDENMVLNCHMSKCQGPSTSSDDKRDKLYFSVENIAVTTVKDLLVSFEDSIASDLELVSSNPRNTSFSVSIPPYIRSFKEGMAAVELSIALASDKVSMASAIFTYYAPPKFASIVFNTVGTSINVVFDGPTDRASMTSENTACDLVLSIDSVAKLGTGSVCVWQDATHLTIFLGKAPTIVPNDIVSVREGVLKSLNQVSHSSTASANIARPLVTALPEVSVKGTNTIDPCSSLEVRTSVLSPRPATVIWSCSNDESLNSYLATISSSTLSLAAGTSQMSTFPKDYVLEVNVVDFLGVSSGPKIFRVLKKATASPRMEFNPPIVETLRNKEVLIKGETVFSACPVEETEVNFQWRQVSGPACCPISASLLSIRIPQLLLPPNILPAGSTYQLALKASMADVSQSSESIVTGMPLASCHIFARLVSSIYMF